MTSPSSATGRGIALRPLDAEGVHLRLMLVLTFTTGIIDAVGYLGLDRVFTGNMTGNVVILGMAAVGADDLPVLGPSLALVGFLAGAAAGGRALRTASSRWHRRTTACLAVSAAGTLALGLVVAVADDLSQPAVVTVTTLLGAAMGLQASAARQVAVADVTTVVVTSTLTALASQSRIAGGSGERSGRRALAAVAILLGAALGAALLKIGVAAGLLVAGALMAAVAIAGAIHERRTAGSTP